MAHFAELNSSNEVISVIVVSNEVLDNKNEEVSGINFLVELFGDSKTWKQTSYNAKIRKNFAGIGYLYDEKLDAFIAPQPFPSWTLDENCQWKAPKPLPDEDNLYIWNEEKGEWDVA